MEGVQIVDAWKGALQIQIAVQMIVFWYVLWEGVDPINNVFFK